MQYDTLTQKQQAKLLKITGEHTDDIRDHVILLMALKTGLRQKEILALNVGQVYHADGSVRLEARLDIFKGSTKVGRRPTKVRQSVGLSHETLKDKLKKLHKEKVRAGHDMSPDAPLFVRSHGGGRKDGRTDRSGRLSERALRAAWAKWQKKAGWDKDTTGTHRFHELRHAAITRYFQVSKHQRGPEAALVTTMRFARHASVASTMIYTHATEEDYLDALKRM